MSRFFFLSKIRLSPRTTHFIVFILSILLSGFIAVHMGKDLSWDLANYHYYNPFSYLYERSKIDYWPSSYIHVYFTPTLDFLTYFLINQFPPKMSVFILGCIHGINIWLLFCIAHLFISKCQNILYPRVLSLILALLGLYGPVALPGIGAFQNDNLISLFVLCFVYLSTKFFVLYVPQKRIPNIYLVKYILFGSLLLGVGIGCKLTAALFAGGAIGAFLLLPLPIISRIQLALVFAVGVTLGILLSSGYWMLYLWQHYQNPVFPLWNEIFQSPYFPLYNWRDTRFLPKNIWQTLFFPFYFSLDGRSGDTYFRDLRFAILYVLFVAYAGLILLRQFFKKTQSPLSLSTKWLFYFFIFSYILWQEYFSIMRYIVALEMLAPLLIFLITYQLSSNATVRFATLVVIYFAIGALMIPTNAIRDKWFSDTYFNIQLPHYLKTSQKETVLVSFSAGALNADPRPQTYLIPYFPKNWQFIGIPFIHNQYSMPQDIIDIFHHFTQDHIYLLSSENSMTGLYKAAQELGFKDKKHCEKILSDRQKVTGQDTLLCLVKK